ncbi:MAG: hypothetical protein ACXVP0_05185 [Bacteroidia bacterium]
MKNLFIVLIAALTLSACTGEKPAAQAVSGKEQKIAYSLQPEQIYDTTSIQAALLKADRHQKAESRKAFLKGLDLLTNKNNPAGSIEFFKESIYYYPDEKNYMHLFKAYINSGDTAGSQIINHMLNGLAQAWHIEYYEIDFNDALIYAVKKDTIQTINSISTAIMDGFVFKERITDEPLFKFMENHLSYQSLIASNFGSDEKLNRMLFKAFLKYYPDLELPFEITLDSARSFNYDKYIDYNFATLIPGMNDGRFSRDVTNEYMYVGKFKMETGYGFVYKSFMAIADTLNPVKTYVVTYDTTGQMIANEMIGCFCSPTESSSFVINKDQTITIHTYAVKWESDPLEKGYAGNKIVSTEEVTKEIISYDQNGKILRDGVGIVKDPDAISKNGR